MQLSSGTEKASPPLTPPPAVIASTSERPERLPHPYITCSAHGDVNIDDGDIKFRCKFAYDGVVDIQIDHRTANASPPPYFSFSDVDTEPPPYLADAEAFPVPGMNVLILAPGQATDIRLMLDFAAHLRKAFGHRVRLATHPAYRLMVEQRGVEFFSIGGEPGSALIGEAVLPRDRVLMRLGLHEGLKLTWSACTEPGKHGLPFVADSVVASPLSWGAVHCAERLGVPICLMTRVPWTPTREFPHPLARIQSSNVGAEMSNLLSYAIVDAMLWNEMGERINSFRKSVLGLEPIDSIFAWNAMSRLQIPTIYFCDMPLSRKPQDWASSVSVCDLSKGMNEVATAFHRGIDVDGLRCALVPSAAASLQSKKHRIALSAVAAEVMVAKGMIKPAQLERFQPRWYDFTPQYFDPLTALASTTYSTCKSVLLGAIAGPIEVYRQASRPGRVGNGAEAAVVATANGVGQIMCTGIMAPLLITHGLALGFHNAPRLYGDETVRDNAKIIGMGSGLAAAGKGFGLGIYDGLSGFFVQPFLGARRGGHLGFWTGFGKGFGGIILKPIAGACALPGYTFMGAYKQLMKLGKKNMDCCLVAARLAQGEHEVQGFSDHQKLHLVNRWREVLYIVEKQQPGSPGNNSERS